MTRQFRNYLLGFALMALFVAGCNSSGSGGEQEPEPPQAPEAVITISPASGSATAPATVNLDGSASTGEITGYQWYLDAEPLSTAETLQHELELAGTYTFRLVVTDDHDQSGSAEAEFEVLPPVDEEPEGPEDPEDPEDPENPEDPEDPEDPTDPEDPEDPTDPEDPEDPQDPEDPVPSPPAAAFTITPPSGSATAPVTINLDATTSTGDITAYQWFIDDAPVSTNVTHGHQLTQAGTYTIRLEVTDDHEQQDTQQSSYVVILDEQGGESHTLHPADFGAYSATIEPEGAWTATTSAAWLSVTPASGSGGTTQVTLTVDPSALSSSSNTFVAYVTVTDTVSARNHQVTAHLPQLTGLNPISRTGLSPNTTTQFPVTLMNSGSSPMTFSAHVQGSGDVQVSLDAPPGVINPGGGPTFALTATCPASPATYNGAVIVTTNDPREPETSVPVNIGCVPTSPDGDYEISLVFQPGAFTPQQQAMVRAAADRWEEVIIGDIPGPNEMPPIWRDICLRQISWDGTITPELAAATADDLLVSVYLYEDAASTLARAGPCGAMVYLPNFGAIMINTARLEYMTTTNSLEAVMIHELGHVLGIGTVWLDEERDLMRPSRDHCTDPQLQPTITRTFAGSLAVGEYHALGGAGQPPLDGLCHHWSEARFQTEVLTPSISIDPGGNNHQPLSRMSIAALEELGYVVDYDAADAYALPGPGMQTDKLGHDGHTFMHGEPLPMFPDAP